MRIIILVTVILISCEKEAEVNFRYSKGNPSGILIENYTPVTRKELTRYLQSVNDTLRMDSINVFLSGNTMHAIDGDFRRRFFRSSLGQSFLEKNSNDTTLLMRTVMFHLGTFKEDSFKKNDDWDLKLLENKFLIEN